jgi:hypothetical protein
MTSDQVPIASPAEPLAEPEREFLVGLLELLDRYRRRMSPPADVLSPIALEDGSREVEEALVH